MAPILDFGQKPNEDLAYIRSARKSWGNLNFESSEQHYKNALDVNQENFNATFELGVLHFEEFKNYDVALRQFERSLELMQNDKVYELYNYLAMSYQYFEKYDKAIEFYELFKTGIIKNEPLKLEIDQKIEQCKFAKIYETVHWDGKFVKMDTTVNTINSEYCVVMPLKDSFMLFNQLTPEVQKSGITLFFENIFFSKEKNKTFHPADKSSEWPAFENINREITGHNAIVSSSITGDSMFIFKQNNLWMSTFKDNLWQVPVKLPKTINIAKYQRHACFSPNGKTIYFSSNSKKGNGGYDLFYSESDGAGNWGAPKNLGAKINTSGNEDSPFITKDGKRLYFSSKGHPGFGGYDVFYCDWEDTAWSAPINAGRPFNSPDDDIYFMISNDQNETAFLSSSRKGGEGLMDIYYFYKYGQPGFQECTTPTLAVTSVDSTNEGFSSWNANIIISGLDTLIEGKEGIYSNKDCFFKEARLTHTFWKQDNDILKQDSLIVKFDSAGTYSIIMEVLARDKNNEELRYCISKTIVVEKEKIIIPYIQPKVFKDTNEMALSIGSKFKEKDMKPLPEGFDVTLKSIYFSFNKSDIRPDQRKIMDANIKLIKENPNIIIKIIGHTDKVGSKEHNLKLSQKRAKSTVNYLVKKGVSLNQIVAVLSNGEDLAGERYKNADGTDNIEKMEVSRRVDFYIIGKTK
jgi:outer membrane protein OmpA-like peptidoglycan-associated protein